MMEYIEEYWQCWICGKKFKTKEEFLEHKCTAGAWVGKAKEPGDPKQPDNEVREMIDTPAASLREALGRALSKAPRIPVPAEPDKDKRELRWALVEVEWMKQWKDGWKR